MAAGALYESEKEKGEPFAIWAMARSTTVDSWFEESFELTKYLAARREPRLLPAVFLILRVREASLFLDLHSWYIPPNDCVFYVLGAYGRDVLPYLFPMLDHADPFVRRNAAFALAYFGDETAKARLIEMLAMDDAGSGGAAFALGEIGAVEALKPVERLLKSRDAMNRLWAAYALFEFGMLGSKEALPLLKAALERENDKNARREMEGDIEILEDGAKPTHEGVDPADKEKLKKLLDEAEESDGLRSSMDLIAASARPENLEQLERIRQKTMNVPSNLGHKKFRAWSYVIKTVRRQKR